MARWIHKMAVLAIGMGVAMTSLSGCDMKRITTPDPSGIATSQYILRLDIVPEFLDINSEGTATAKLRAHLTDWHGSNLSNKTVFFETSDISITFSAQTDVTTTTVKKTTEQTCNLDCVTNCGTPVTTALSTKTDIVSNIGFDCPGVIDGHSFGKINTRYVKTGTDGMAITNYFPFKSHKARSEIFNDLLPRAEDCVKATLGGSTEDSFTQATAPADLNGDGTDDACIVTVDTTTTSITITDIIFDLPDSYLLPVTGTWIENSFPYQVSDMNQLQLHFPQWNNN